jgi:hypothetical protein
MGRNLPHIAKAVGTLTFLMVAFTFAPGGQAETTAGGKKESKRPVLSVAGSEHTRTTITKAALRAVLGAAPYTMLPKDKYDAWKEVILNFDTSQLNR